MTVRDFTYSSTAPYLPELVTEMAEAFKQGTFCKFVFDDANAGSGDVASVTAELNGRCIVVGWADGVDVTLKRDGSPVSGGTGLALYVADEDGSEHTYTLNIGAVQSTIVLLVLEVRRWP